MIFSNPLAACVYNFCGNCCNYTEMVDTFDGDGLSIPPEITNNLTYAPTTTEGFYEHIFTDDYSDALCRECHEKKVTESTYTTSFMHNLTKGDCENCHWDFDFMNNRNKPDKYVNNTMYNKSVHGNRSNIWCWDCHTTSNHPDPESYWKWCECCHSYQSDPINETDRHNVTADPLNYNVTVDGTPTPVLDITNCTICHNATRYNTAKDTFNRSSGKDCRYCHTYPDQTYD